MEQALNDLIRTKEKRIKTSIIFQIVDMIIDNMTDQIKVDLIELNNTSSKYKNLYLIKGDIFPTPRINDFLAVNELYLDYDEYYLKIKLFLNAKIDTSKDIVNKSNIISEENDLGGINLVNYFKKLLNNQGEFLSSIFIVNNLDNELNNYQLLNLKNIKKYIISFNSINALTKEQVIMIDNFQVSKNNEIIMTDLTMTKTLEKDEQFFYVINRYMETECDIFKVIDVEDNFLILINCSKNLFKLKNNILNANLGKIIYIGNFSLKKLDNKFQLIIINKDTYIKISKDVFIDVKKLSICKLSCIKFYIKDFMENNQYEFLVINNITQKITEKEIYFIFSTINQKYLDYFSIEILLKHKDKNEPTKNFNFLLYQGFLNKINLFVNISTPKTYFYEYYYLNLYNIIDNNIGTLLLEDGTKVEIDAYDNFNSQNRRRINLMNVTINSFNLNKNKVDPDIKNIISNITFNSVQICNLIKDNIEHIFGIFNIGDYKIPDMESNDIFDDYYDVFGNIYEELVKKNYYIEEETFSEYIDKYDKCNLDKNISHFLIKFNEDITLSQYKTRLGYLICYYYALKRKKKEFPKIFATILFNINLLLSNKRIELIKKLRIISFYLRTKVENPYSSIQLHFFEELKKLNPKNAYTLANEFNLNEINNLNEFSRLFLAYIQLDSYILYNHFKNTKSYTFSMEPLYLTKLHLKSNYEEFFFTTRDKSENYTYQALDEKITIINEKNLFKKEKYDDGIIEITEDKESKNYAFSASMEFRHKKNCHRKFARKNLGENSPTTYFKDLKFETTKKKVKQTNEIKFESGEMIEKFISTDESIINDLKTKLIYGELLDYNLFIDKNFDDLLKRMKEINTQNISKGKNEPKKKSDVEKNEKSDKSYINSQKSKKEIELMKRYEEIGVIIAGDIIYSKSGRENIKYYKNSELFINSEDVKNGKNKEIKDDDGKI